MKIKNINILINKNNTVTQNKFLTKISLPNKIDLFYKSEGCYMREKFINLRNNICEKLYPTFVKTESSAWNFYINSTDENLEKLTIAEDEYFSIFKDKKYYKELKQINIENLNKSEQLQLKKLLKNFEEQLETGEDFKLLRSKESEIAKKYNSYIPKIDDKEVSKTEISKILEKETDVELRNKAYQAKIIGGDLIAEDLKTLVKQRNDFAIKKGFSNFYEYNLEKEFNVDLNDLTVILDEVYNETKDGIKKVILKKHKDLKNVFDIDNLKQYHYGYLTENNPDKKINEYFENKEQILELSKKTYSGIGYDIEKFVEEGKLVLDLYPRKGKNTHGFCFGIDAGKNARILANLTNNSYSLDTLNHELGHCVYTLGVSRDLPFIVREEHPAMTEAIAMMMGDLHKRENVLADIVPQNILEEFKQKFIEDDLSFISRALIIINFEKEMYKNPDQDLKKLWHEMRVKYALADENEELNNEWATIPHYLSHPVYYQNYFRANVYKNKMYKYLTSKFGNLTENKSVAEFLNEKLFKLGSSVEEKELMKIFE